MENNDLHKDSEIIKEIKEFENEAKRNALRTVSAKRKLIRELKGNLGETIKSEPNKITRISDNNKKLSFIDKIKKFISKIFKSI